MIIKSVTINNFRSYYGENTFEFSKGLTLIIGGNGDGKTTFFEALEWLLDTVHETKDPSLISEMRKSELDEDEADTMSVSMFFEHNGEKEVSKSLTFEKKNGVCRVTNFAFKGYETNGAERMQRKGSSLIDVCFDAFIRKYCLFKGESQLNVFNEKEALRTLVDKFSDIHKFEDYVAVATELEAKSDQAYAKECQSDKKISQKVSELQYKKERLGQQIDEIKRDIRKQEDVVSTYSVKLEDLEKHQATSESYQDIKKRIDTQREKLAKLRSMTMVRYNTNLLDEFWALMPYQNVFEEFQKKVSALSKEKRRLSDLDIQEKAATKAKKEVVDELTSSLQSDFTRLPWYLPDGETMQEMLDEEVCKVCGRPAKKGTQEYRFMENKLREYLECKSQELAAKQEELPDTPLFGTQYIEELHSLSISFGGMTARDIAKKYREVVDKLEFVARIKQDIAEKEAELLELEDEKSRLLIQADGLTEAMLDKNFRDIKGFYEQRDRAKNRISDYREQLAKVQLEYDKVKEEFEQLNPTTGMAKVYNRVHTLLDKVMWAFVNAKSENLRRFLASLEERTNSYFEKLNKNDFRGLIRIVQTASDSAEIKLFSSNGTPIKNPGGAQETTMYMSLLFAISDLTTLKREEDYPLIFDAPTSSFENFKENVFYNIIDKIQKQCIIVTKDLLEVDKQTGKKTLNEAQIEALTCSVYRIEKQTGYNETDLSTIRTIITPIK